MKTHLDWSAYDTHGIGDPYAGIPVRGGAYAKAVAACIGSRQCQRMDRKGVMCPSFRITEDPVHSTRGRVEALKAVLNGEVGTHPDAIDFDDPALAEAMALCIGCKGCKRECPNGVDMALLRAEYLAQKHARTGTPWRDRLFANATRLLEKHAPLRWMLQLRNRMPLLSALGEHLFGISRHRRLPEPAQRPSSNTGASSTNAAEGPEVMLLIDSFTRVFEPENANAAYDVLTTAGYRVRIVEPAGNDPTPSEPLCCGRAALSSGLIAQARQQAQRLVAALQPALEAGTPIVGLEPSCLYMLRDEYFSLGLDMNIEKLARQSFLFEDFLIKEHAAGRLQLTFGEQTPRQVVVHGHCHQKAFGGMKAMKKALALIPGVQLELIEAGCCGMAGSFGVEAEHHALSMRMAEAELLPAIRSAPAEAIIVADGFSCRQQISDGSRRTAIHAAVLIRNALNGSAQT
ncbi:MAG: 4Fe-4S dicluster domain-containing protein [Rhodocyclaceae bacterium]|jgi:Fe-S oxidoreductase|nr:4Fe-4S dicluster domain-containing protein [Rhodocyclaceae bacterium]